MSAQDMTREQLLAELEQMRLRLADLEAREIEHHCVEAALIESEAKFRKLTERAVVGVYLIQEGLFRYVNPKLAQIFGYRVHELVNEKGPQDLVYVEDWPEVDQNLRKRFSGLVDALYSKFRGVRRDGQIIHVEVYGSRMEYKGRPAVIGTLLDISEPLKARGDLQSELRKLRLLYDLAVAMTAERTLDENLGLLVEQSREMLGADKAFIALRDARQGDLYMHALSGIVTDEFKRLRIRDGVGLGGKVAETGRLSVVEDYFEEVGPAFHDVAKAEGLMSGIAVPVKIGNANLGVLYVFNRTRTPFKKADLDTLSLLGNLAAVEITRKRAEMGLRASQEEYKKLYEESKRGEELYLSLLNSSADAIVIYDLDGRAQYVNLLFVRMFGWTMEEVVGRRIPFLPDSEREATMAIIDGLIADGIPTHGFETRRFTKDGKLLDVSISASRYHDHEGRPAGTLVILRDITDRKRAEERIRESEASLRLLYEESRRREELYRSVLNSSADAIVIYDMEGCARYVNPAFTRIFGWTTEELLGKRIPFVPEAEREVSLSMIQSIIRDGAPCSAFETLRFTKDGRTLNISISASRYRDHEGNPAGMLVILRDITRRKRAEQALKESEERFRTLAEVAPFGLVVIAADEKAEYLNPKFTDIFGYTLDDVPDVDSWLLRAYEDKSTRIAAASMWREEAESIRGRDDEKGSESVPRMFSVKAKNGSEKIVDFRAVVLPDGKILTTFLDVTAEAKAREEIVRAKNEWERTFNAVSDLILILDGEQRVTRANDAVAGRVGVDADALVGLQCSQAIHGDMTLAPLCLEPTLLTDGQEHAAEITDKALGGVFDLRVFPLRNDKGKLFGSVHVARDVTAFKSMEQARRRAVHHLSHELKTPLAVIKGSLKNFSAPDATEESRQANVDRMRRNLQRLSEIQHIVQEIVEPRRYEPTSFPVVATIEAELEDLRARSAHRSVSLISSLEPVETGILDPGVLKEVVDTLVKNAIENTPDGGEVLVSLREVAEGVLLQVTDSGMGIGPGDRDFVFGAFHHTQDTEQYATRKPFAFNAGGKGLELLRLKILSEEGHFDISFDTGRCRHIPAPDDQCPGSVAACPNISSADECKESGGTTFSVLFHGSPQAEGNH